MTFLETTMDDMLRTAHRKNLALGLFLGTIEGALQSRHILGDTALLDLIALSVDRVNGALAEIKEGALR